MTNLFPTPGRGLQHPLHSRAREAPRRPLHGLCPQAVALTPRLRLPRGVQNHRADADLRRLHPPPTSATANVLAAANAPATAGHAAATSSIRLVKMNQLKDHEKLNVQS